MDKKKTINILVYIISLFICAVFLSCIRIAYAQSGAPGISQYSNLSPAISVSDADFSRNLHRSIIDSYMRSSMLSPYEYRVLKLDIFFNVKINPAEIEKSLTDFISKEDMLYYFEAKSPDKEITRTVRLKIRNKFEMILREHSYDLDISMLDYLEALMRRISEKQDKKNAVFKELFLPMSTAKMLRTLTDNDILLFNPNPSSLKEHALKKKIIHLMNGVLVEEGVALDAKVWDAITEVIEAKKKKLLAQVRLYVNAYKSELKERLCSELLLSQISHYSIEHSGYNIERQKARANAFAIFMQFLQDKQGQIEQDPYFEKVTLYKEGIMWESRYWAMLDEIMRELTEVDAISYEYSLKKILGRKITKDSPKDMNLALDIIVKAEKAMLREKDIDYKTYRRIRAVNNSSVNNFLIIDDSLVMQIADGFVGRERKVFGDIWFVEEGQKVLYQTYDKKTGESEFFIFSQEAPFIQTEKVRSDYARLYREHVKAFIASRLSAGMIKQFINYSKGDPADWDKAYEDSRRIASECENFFITQFGLKPDKDIWRLVLDVMAETIDNPHITLSKAESEFLNLSLPFRPNSTVMKITAADIIPELSIPTPFDLLRQNTLKIAQAI